jgi:hypothetical protein
MSGIWYCRSCGYEVDKGGRCHNCHQSLLETNLTELEEGEVDDEVGYRLDDWDDEGRGALIEALVDEGIRHRFEGDELVVGSDDEAAVDAIAARVAGAPVDGETGGDGVNDEAAVGAVEALYDASARLRLDPTDMHADGDLAEASAAVFAVERLYGVDPGTWAAVGRVTRRLLGALGADEALEDDIAAQATILCRLLEPIAAPQERESVPWQTSQSSIFGLGGTRYSPPSETETESEIEAEIDDQEAGEPTVTDDDGPATARPGDDGPATARPGDAEGPDAVRSEAEEADDGDEGEVVDHHEVVYELDDWLPEERAQLGLLLDRDGIAHGWEGHDLIVAEVDEDRTEPLLDEVDRSASGVFADATDGTDDEEEYQALSDLFGTADRLAGDPEDKNKRPAFADAVALVLDWPTPFGLSDEQWWQIKSRSRSVLEAIETGAEADVVATRAATLSELLRGLL